MAKNKEKQELYQGPVKQGYDLEKFRKTGKHVKKSISVLSIFLLFILSLVSVNAYNYESADYKQYIHATDVFKLEEKRHELIDWVWLSGRTNYTPTITTDVLFSTATNFVISDTSNLEQIDKYTIITNKGFTSHSYLFVPIISNNRLFIYSEGHGTVSGQTELINALLNEGYYVLARYLPGTTQNTGPVSGSGSAFHNNMAVLKTSTYNPIEEFYNDLYSLISYFEDNYNFQDISMTGVSGGGNAVVWYGALDNRIKNTFPIAGNYPRFVVNDTEYTGSIGDFEQGTSGSYVWDFLLYNVSELDMYIISMYDGTHKAVYNQDDSCCFQGTAYTIYEDYLSNLGVKYNTTFDVYLTTATTHSITTSAINYILANDDYINQTTKVYPNFIKVNINAETNSINSNVMRLGFNYSTTEQTLNWLSILAGWGL